MNKLFAFLFAVCACAARGDVVVENARFRLTLADGGYAKSLTLKASGEEMLEAGAKVPFSAITQNRAYDNEFKLMYAAKPWTLPSERIERVGDELRIRYRDEFFTAVVALEVTDDYVGFRLVRFDYELEASGFKRKTEIDSFALAQLPIRRRTHFGRTLNVMWDDRSAVALMAARPETRIDAFARDGGGQTFFAGSEKAVGLCDAHAVLAVAEGREPFLDCVDAFERDYNLPRGVASRRNPLYAASYLAVGDITPENADEYVRIAQAGGFRALLTFGDGALWRTVGHFPPKPAYANGPADFRKVTDRIRAAGILPGLHFFCTKVSTNDTYLAGGRPDPRMNTVCELTLARDVSAADADIPIQERPTLFRRERNRGLVLIGDELVMCGGATDVPPYALTNCVRGLWGSPAAAHPRNAVARHLDVDDWVIFVRCAANGITDEIADRIAEWVNGADVRFFYMDGAEDVPEPFWYHVPRAQGNVWKRFRTDPVWSETALKSHFGWHMQSRGNGFDTFKGELQRPMLRKYVLRTARQDADDFSAVDLGWMKLQPPRRPDPTRHAWNGQYAKPAFWNGTIGTQPDVFEYVCAKGAAWNCPVAVKVSLADYREHPHADDCLRAFRRWEDAKLAHRFTSVQLEAFKDEDREWFLWPFAAEGTVEPVECRQVTDDAERPIRAFSYRRGDVGGILCWDVETFEPPEITLSSVETEVRRDGGRVFLEARASEEELVKAFRAAAGNSHCRSVPEK